MGGGRAEPGWPASAQGRAQPLQGGGSIKGSPTQFLHTDLSGSPRRSGRGVEGRNEAGNAAPALEVLKHTLLARWAGHFLIVGTVLCTVGSLAAALASTH